MIHPYVESFISSVKVPWQHYPPLKRSQNPLGHSWEIARTTFMELTLHEIISKLRFSPSNVPLSE